MHSPSLLEKLSKIQLATKTRVRASKLIRSRRQTWTFRSRLVHQCVQDPSRAVLSQKVLNGTKPAKSKDCEEIIRSAKRGSTRVQRNRYRNTTRARASERERTRWAYKIAVSQRGLRSAARTSTKGCDAEVQQEQDRACWREWAACATNANETLTPRKTWRPLHVDARAGSHDPSPGGHLSPRVCCEPRRTWRQP